MPRQAKKPKDGPARQGRAPDDNVRERILRVAERLFAEKGFRGTTVRDIANAAHVTHPLIYHYWGSKRGLLAAVLERSQTRMRAVADIDGEPLEVFERLVRENLDGNRLYLLTMTRAFAEGMRAADWPGGFPAVEAILDRLTGERPEGVSRPSHAEVRELVAAAVAMAVGWVLVEEQLLEIVGLPPDRRDEARERLLRSFEEVLRPTVPPGRD